MKNNKSEYNKLFNLSHKSDYYLNNNDKESKAFLELCTNNIQNISENNFIF